MPPIEIPITSPVKGINRVVAREGQPPDNCWDALNVLPFDSFGRRRVAQRFGLAKQFSNQLSNSTKVQGMLPVSEIVYPVVLNSTGLIVFTESFASLAGWSYTSGLTPSTTGGSTYVTGHGGPLTKATASANTAGSTTLTIKWQLPSTARLISGDQANVTLYVVLNPSTSTAVPNQNAGGTPTPFYNPGDYSLGFVASGGNSTGTGVQTYLLSGSTVTIPSFAGNGYLWDTWYTFKMVFNPGGGTVAVSFPDAPSDPGATYTYSVPAISKMQFGLSLAPGSTGVGFRIQ